MRKILARIIIEVLGSPKEHVEETIKQIIQKLEQDKKVKLVKQTTYESEQQEKTKLWSTFSEIELQADNLKNLMEICFDYMPSSVEIIEPAGMEVDSNDIMDFMNDLLGRIHKYDMVLKNMHAENKVMRHDLELIKQVAKEAFDKKKKGSD